MEKVADSIFCCNLVELNFFHGCPITIKLHFVEQMHCIIYSLQWRDSAVPITDVLSAHLSHASSVPWIDFSPWLRWWRREGKLVNSIGFLTVITCLPYLRFITINIFKIYPKEITMPSNREAALLFIIPSSSLKIKIFAPI